MKKASGITITDVFATTKRVILCLSADAEPDSYREEAWKNPGNYSLARIQEDGERVEIPLTDETISYTNEIPAVIFLVENEAGDHLHLVYKHIDKVWNVVVGSISIPVENEICKEVLSKVSVLQEQVTTITESVDKLVYEDLPVIKQMIENLADTDTNPEEILLEKINKELIADREEIRNVPPGEPADPDEQLVKNELVNTIIGNWKEILNLVKEAQENKGISPAVKNKIERLRVEVGRHLAYYGHLKQRIALNSKLVKVQILKRDELSRLNAAVEWSR
jgi:hypothetical protein